MHEKGRKWGYRRFIGQNPLSSAALCRIRDQASLSSPAKGEEAQEPMRKRVPERAREFARGLRTYQTDAEWRLWVCLRAGRLAGLKFKRQVPIDGYIVDFVCLEARLIIEVDGEQHAESTRDRLRDARFAAAGFQTLRFWNSDVLQDVDEIAYQIRLAAEARLHRLLPLGGGG